MKDYWFLWQGRNASVIRKVQAHCTVMAKEKAAEYMTNILNRRGGSIVVLDQAPT